MEKSSWFITFGSGTPLANHYIQLDNMTNEEARWWAHKTFDGKLWCGCYPLTQLFEIAKKWPEGLTKINLPSHLNYPVDKF